eukprot:9388165-Lingulodinium_polyedra.AAC.1
MGGARIFGKALDAFTVYQGAQQFGGPAAYLPPQGGREVGWREARAGDPAISTQATQACAFSGTRPKQNMKVFYAVKHLNNAK